MDTDSFWITYSSALEMLQIVIDSSLAPHLSCFHDAVHVMIAYAAVFLIKVSTIFKSLQELSLTLRLHSFLCLFIMRSGRK